MTVLNLDERTKDFTLEQHARLVHYIDMAIRIIGSPEMPAVLLHAVMISEGAAVVVAHCLSGNGDEANEMLDGFFTARQAEKAVRDNDTPTH